MAGERYRDFDVLFERRGTGFQARVVKSLAGEGQVALFERPLSDLELENFVLRVGRFRARSRRADTVPVAAAKQTGGRLYEAVFSGAVGECLKRSIDRARDERAALRIRLRLDGCGELADLPWELLYDAESDWFLSLSGRTPVIRYVQIPNQPRPVPTELPLRILVIRSEPLDCPPLDLAGEWAQVATAMAELTGSGLVSFTELAAPTLAELRRALLRDTFHVLHYMGHGGYDEQRGGVLLFTGRNGASVPVTGGDLGVMLNDHDSLRLTVLNACEAGRTDPLDPFAGVADALVRRGIPAVVAMQFEVSDDAACEFAPALYGALAAGHAIDSAVAEARKAIYTISPLEWATPVLYLRADDARLFDLSQPRPVPGTERASASAPGDQPETPPAASAGAASPTPPVRAAVARAVAHAERGDALFARGHYSESVAAYRSALIIDDCLARAYAGLGDVLPRLRRYQEAEAAGRQAVRLDPLLTRAYCSLGNALCCLKRFDEANAACREAITMSPADPDAYMYLGYVLDEEGRYVEAEAAYRESIRLDPARPRTYINLGGLFDQMARAEEAEAAYREAVQLAPESAVPLDALGNFLYFQRRYAEAETAHREATRLDPDGACWHSDLSDSLSMLGRYDEAESESREAIRLDRGYFGGHYALGYSLHNLGRHAEAVDAYREAIRLAPIVGYLHTNLASSLDALGRKPEARKARDEAARLGPEGGPPS